MFHEASGANFSNDSMGSLFLAILEKQNCWRSDEIKSC